MGSTAQRKTKQNPLAREAERIVTTQAPPPNAEEVNPLARIAGSYADDPNWDEFLQAMEASRRALDEETEAAD